MRSVTYAKGKAMEEGSGKVGGGVEEVKGGSVSIILRYVKQSLVACVQLHAYSSRAQRCSCYLNKVLYALIRKSSLIFVNVWATF